MRISGAERLTSSRTAVWDVLEDPERLAGALPNVEDFVRTGPVEFEVTIRPALGLGEVPFATTWRREGGQTGAALSYAVAGHSGEYLLDLRADLRLRDDGPGTTVDWNADLELTSPMRALGQRTLGAIFRRQIGLVLAAADRAG